MNNQRQFIYYFITKGLLQHSWGKEESETRDIYHSHMNREACKAWQRCSAWGAVLVSKEGFLCVRASELINFLQSYMTVIWDFIKIPRHHHYLLDVRLFHRLHLTPSFVLLLSFLSFFHCHSIQREALTHSHPGHRRSSARLCFRDEKHKMHVGAESNLSELTSRLLSSDKRITHLKHPSICVPANLANL